MINILRKNFHNTIALALLLTITSNVQANSQSKKQAHDSKPETESFCLQNLNTFGPIYSRNLKERTKAFTKYLTKNKTCEIVNLQEVWLNKHHKSLMTWAQANELQYVDFDKLRDDGKKHWPR